MLEKEKELFQRMFKLKIADVSKRAIKLCRAVKLVHASSVLCFFQLTSQRPSPKVYYLRLTKLWLSYKSSLVNCSAGAIWTRNHMIAGHHHHRFATTPLVLLEFSNLTFWFIFDFRSSFSVSLHPSPTKHLKRQNGKRSARKNSVS